MSDRIEVTLVEKKSEFEVWVAELKFATFKKSIAGRADAVATQNAIWKLLNYLGRISPIKAVKKKKPIK
jgi:hypothetical protein